MDITWRAPPSADATGAARWVYAPQRPSTILGSISQADRSWVAWGRDGERWLVRETGEAEAAGDLAPEDLVGLSRGASGAWRFVGRTGALYEAASPLGAFSRISRPRGTATAVSASGSTVAIVGERGALSWSNDAGETWRDVKLDARWILDVRVEGERGVVLGLPERLFVTRDGGRTFARIEAPPVGASRLSSERGVVTALGYQRAVELDAGDAPRLVDASEPVSPPPFVVPPRAVVDGADLTRGRGFVWRGTVYVPITKRDKPGAPASLGRGRLGEHLEVTPLAGTERCSELSLAGDDRALYAACLVPQRGSARGRVRVLRYTNVAEAPEELSGALEGTSATRLVLGPSDRLIVWGACRRTEERCDVETPLWLGQWDPASEGVEAVGSPWGATRAPALGGGVLDVKFAGRGATVYLVGRRAKSGDLGLFVSADAGRTFEARELPLPDHGVATAASISVTEPGVITIAIEGAAPAVVLADQDGRALSVGAPPVRTSSLRLGVAGRRALAVTPGEAWESSDAGVSWTSLGAVGALRCQDARGCAHPVSCAPEGCVVGAKVARIGWGAERAARQVLDLDADVAPSRGIALAAPPLVCRLRRDKWQRLPAGTSAPGAGESERGRVAFSTVSVDPMTAAVTVVHGSPSGKLDELTLLPKVPQAGGVAVLALPQVEGAAALRFAVREGARPDGPAIVSPRTGDSAHPAALEVAWENLLEGKVGRATLRPSPAPSAAFTEPTEPGGAHQARPELLSITAGGIYVRPDAGGLAELFFVDYAGRVERSAYQPWPSVTRLGEPLQVNADAVRIGATTVPFAVVRSAAEPGSNTERRAATGLVGRGVAVALTPAQEPGFDTNTSFSYASGAPLLVTQTRTRDGGRWEISTFAFRAQGLVDGGRAGPTQTRALERPRPCAEDDRAKTPRIVAPADPGTRRAVLIEGPDGARFAALVSSAMVLYGTAESPCQAGLDAASPLPTAARAGEDRLHALVSIAEQTGWLFRGGREVEARPMTCRTDPKAQVPLEVLRELDGLARAPATDSSP